MIKLTRNKMIAELVLQGHTLEDVGKAFSIAPSNVRSITCNLIGIVLRTKAPALYEEPKKVDLTLTRTKASQVIPLIRMIDKEDVLWRKAPGKRRMYRADNSEGFVF